MLVERAQLLAQVRLRDRERVSSHRELAACRRLVAPRGREGALDVGELPASPVETRGQRVDLEQRGLLAGR